MERSERLKKYKSDFPSSPIDNKAEKILIGSGERVGIHVNKRTIQPYLPNELATKLSEGEYAGGIIFLESRSKKTISLVLKDAAPAEELFGRELIKPYLKVLPARIIRDRKGKLYIASPYNKSPTIEYLLAQDEPKALNAIKDLTVDLQNMWETTKAPYNPELLKRDYSEMSAKNITGIFSAAVEKMFDGKKEILDKNFTINGIDIGKPSELIKDMISSLVEVDIQGNIVFEKDKNGEILYHDPEKTNPKAMLIKPDYMHLSHGDEIPNNILATDSNNGNTKTTYKLIDPRLAGYYDKSWVLALQLLTRINVFSIFYGSTNRTNIFKNKVEISNFTRVQTLTTKKAKDIMFNLIKKEVGNSDIDLRRTATFAFISIARSITGQRDKLWKELSERNAIPHFIEGLCVYKQIMNLATGIDQPLENIIYLTRHGEDEAYAAKKHNGWLKNNPLTKLGRKQAQQAAKQLKSEKIDAIFSSDLDRAVETAKTISNEAGVKVVCDSRIRDRRRSGKMEGMHFSEFSQLQEYLEFIEKRNDPDFKLNDGESLNDRKNMAMELFHEKVLKYNRPLIVSHGDTINGITQALTGESVPGGQLNPGSTLVIEGSTILNSDI